MNEACPGDKQPGESDKLCPAEILELDKQQQLELTGGILEKLATTRETL